MKNLQQKQKLKKFLIARVSALTDTSVKEISTSKPFNLMGLSSLDGIQLVDDINQFLSASFSPTILFDYPNINELLKFLLNPQAQQGYFEIKEPDEIKKNTSEPIAVVGMSCNFPGAADISAYEKLLFEGMDAVKKIPRGRWKDKPKNLKAWAGLIDNPNAFDNDIFDVYEKESQFLDPQQRKILELAWHAVEHAGYAPADVMGTNTGVYIGISSNDYSLAKVEEGNKVEIYDGIGGAHSIAANRISYFFNFNGPSWAVDTACSSSLISISQAIGHLRASECDMALAGGVNILYTSHLTQSFQKAGMLSPDGKCKTFSDDANGYVRGEGGGLLLLKRLSDAKKDGDKIWGIFRGFAFNQDGRSNGLTAPNGRAQEGVIRRALNFARLKPEDIDYIELHGTGTPLGDPIEYNAIKSVFKDRENALYVGSVKSNIGHLEAAAGVAGTIKVLLAMHKGMLYKNLHFKKLNSKINPAGANIEVVTKNIPFNKIMRAGVSSFGFGGTNAHIVLESPSPDLSNELRAFNVTNELENNVLLVSASTEETLNKYVAKVLNRLKQIQPQDLENFCYAHNKRSSILKIRDVIYFKDYQDALNKLGNYNYAQGKVRKIVDRSKAFLFTGQGSQSPNMEEDLYNHLPLFSKYYDEVKNLFEKKHHVDFQAVNENIYETNNAQIALFAQEYALFKVLQSAGASADYFVGHSLGEIVAYTCAGGMKLEDAVDLIFYRGKFMQESPAGGMIAVFLTKTEIEELIKQHKLNLSIAAINQVDSIVLSGKKEEIERCEKVLIEKNVRNKVLPVKQGFHSYLMDDVLAAFANKISHLKFYDTDIPVVSSVTGKILDGESVNAEYWVRQIRQTTNFYQAVKKLEEFEIQEVIEIGPHPTLVHMIKASLKGLQAVYYVQNRKQTGMAAFFEFIGNYFKDGKKLNLSDVLYKKHFRWIDIPLTEFQQKEFSFNTLKKVMKMKQVKLDKSTVLSEVKKIVGDQLDLPLDQIDETLPIMNFGADSLVLLNVLDTIQDKYGVAIAIADVFQDLSNIELIAKHVADNSIQTVGQEVEVVAQDNEFDVDFDMPSIQVPGNIQDIVNSQLAIMKKQLDVLNNIKPGATISSTVSSNHPHLNKAMLDKSEHETNAKGVLGNFKTGASKENFQTQVSADYLKKLIEQFSEKTKASKAWSEKYRQPLADNRVSAGFRPNLKEMVYPIVWERAKGAYFWDMDGNKYLDFTMGFGVNLFGHSPDFIQSAITEQLDKGMALGPQSHMAGMVAKMFCEITGNERLAFLNSGTEAVMTCIRLARAKTKRETVVIFEGSYHGHFDGVLGRSNVKHETVPVAAGVPKTLIDGLVVLDYGAPESIEFIRENADQLAAVLVESVQSRYPEHQPKEFLQEIRKITETSGTAFIFDEVITGLRAGAQGAQAFFEVKADLAAYGKILGGGMPIGAVAGKHEYLDFIDGGEWHFGDESMPLNEMTFFAGTFCKHSLAMAASYETLKEISKNGDAIYHNLNSKTGQMATELNHFFQEQNIALEIVHFSSLFRFKFTGNMDLLFYHLNLRGLYVWEGRNMFLSTAHSDEDINHFIKTVKEIIKELIGIGYIAQTNTKNIETAVKNEKNVLSMPMTPAHKRFQEMSLNSSEGKLASKITIAIKIEGDYNTDKLKLALEDIFNRHESLRSSYDLKNSLIKFNSLPSIKVCVVDFSSLDNKETAVEKWLEESAKQEFDLSKECAKLDLLLLNASNCVIAFSGHHIALDGLSLAMLSFDVAETYSTLTGKKKQAKIKEVSFIDFLKELELSPAKQAEQIKYWKQQYNEIPAPLFATNEFVGGRIAEDLSLDLSKKVKFYGYRNKSSLMNTLLLSLLKTLREVYGRDEFVIGIPMAGHKNISDSMVGNCVNLLPFKLKYDGTKSDADTIADIKSYQLESFRYSEIPYETVKAELGKDIIEVVLNVEPINELPEFGNLKTKLMTYPSFASEYPVYINAMKVEDEINLTMDYQNSALSGEDGAKDFLTKYIEQIKCTVS